jgi:hypothetical protein
MQFSTDAPRKLIEDPSVVFIDAGRVIEEVG